MRQKNLFLLILSTISSWKYSTSIMSVIFFINKTIFSSNLLTLEKQVLLLSWLVSYIFQFIVWIWKVSRIENCLIFLKKFSSVISYYWRILTVLWFLRNTIIATITTWWPLLWLLNRVGLRHALKQPTPAAMAVRATSSWTKFFFIFLICVPSIRICRLGLLGGDEIEPNLPARASSTS